MIINFFSDVFVPLTRILPDEKHVGVL